MNVNANAKTGAVTRVRADVLARFALSIKQRFMQCQLSVLLALLCTLIAACDTGQITTQSGFEYGAKSASDIRNMCEAALPTQLSAISLRATQAPTDDVQAIVQRCCTPVAQSAAQMNAIQRAYVWNDWVADQTSGQMPDQAAASQKVTQALQSELTIEQRTDAERLRVSALSCAAIEKAKLGL